MKIDYIIKEFYNEKLIVLIVEKSERTCFRFPLDWLQADELIRVLKKAMEELE
jgi:hypothetical protein